VNRPLVEKLFAAHRKGVGRHGNLLWSLLVLARWGERYLPAAARA
jgi:asparagine synthase (glutamine-hydrolysing)